VNNPFSFTDLFITFVVVGSIFTIGYLEAYFSVKDILLHHH
jgi:hypothetical protein